MALRRKASPTVVRELVTTRAGGGAADLPGLVASAAGGAAPTALTASAAEIEVKPGVMPRPIQAQAWQKETWRLLDIVGEFRFAANRFGAALSRCRLYVAEVDEYGKPGKEATDKAVQALAETVYGGPAAKAEAIRMIGVQLYAIGESFTIAEDRTSEDKDKWYVVVHDQIQVDGGSYTVRRPQQHGGGKHTIRPTQDLMMRVWTPHPRDADQADSPARSVLPVLREIERLSLLTMSQIDSRLISAGLMLLPEGLDFPHAADQPGGVVGLMEMILEAAQAQLTGAGDARGLVPLMLTIPAGTAKDIVHLRFDTPIQNEIKEKLDHAIRRLALGLDIAPEELLGQGDSNHWSAWAVDETSVKLFISPVLARICDALTTGYLAGALTALGKDPEKFCYWFDTAALAARPDQREDSLKLWEKGVLSTKALLEAHNFGEDDKPEPDEELKWRLWELVKLQPALVYDPAFQEAFGLPALAQQAPPSPPALPGQPGPGEGEEDAEEDQRALPDQAERTNVNEEDGGPPGRESPEQFAARILPAAELLVFRALEMAGGRLRPPRRDRDSAVFASTEKFDMHTLVPVLDRDHAEQLLVGGFAHAGRVDLGKGVDWSRLVTQLQAYCVELLVHRHPHRPELLGEVLRRWNGGT